MKVGKPQSKRKSTRLQKGIQKKIAAHNRKQKKLSKRDPTWKSRHPKDPGIPNSFPFKGELLEEIERKKQEEIEARALRREELRQQAIERGATDQDIHVLEQQQDVHESQNRLGALMQSVQQAAVDFDGEMENDVEMSEDDTEGSDVGDNDEQLDTIFEEMRQDTSRKAFDKYFKQVVDVCDVIVYVLDARNPLGTRSKQVEEAVLANPQKRLILALNKIDLVPTDVLAKWVKTLSRSFPTIPINASASAPNAHTFDHPKGMSRIGTASKLLEALKKYAGAADLRRSVTAGVIGFPNVGKSSVINSLLSRHGTGSARSCPVGAQAGVTTDVRRVKIDNKLAILDSPGIVFPAADQKRKAASPVDEQARLILLNAMPPRYIDDCRPAATKLIKRLRKNPDQFELFVKHYDLPPVPDYEFEEFLTQVLVHVSRKMGRLGKGGVPDLRSAAHAIVNDWTSGRLAGWAPAPEDPPVDASKVEVVQGWAKEFDLDGILDGLLDN